MFPPSISLANLLLIIGSVVTGMTLHNLFFAAPQYGEQQTERHRRIQWVVLALGISMALGGLIVALKVAEVIP